jgi:FKBP-type peptidyl-prolyl cis-trans isomerase
VIEGWLDGLLGIEEEGTRRLTIPPHLAFGRQGRCLSDGTCPVPPNTTVIYTITVVSIMDDVIIEVIAEGTGEAADNGNALLVDYTGTFLDGRVFDSTGLAGQPFSFVLGFGRVIAGWDEGLIGMKVGGIRDLTIPPHMAYGAAGRPGAIPPYTTLKFRIELLGLASQ